MEAGPFRPLKPFNETDRTLFFGRDRELAELVERLNGERTGVMLHGESGIGKTSLVRAALLPMLKQRGGAVAYLDCARSLDESVVPMSAGSGALLVLDNLGAAVDDGQRLERLVALLQRAASVRGLKVLFVLDDANLWRLDALERRVGPIAPSNARMRLDRLDEARLGDIIERTVLGGGTYFEAGLSHEMAVDLAKAGPVSPSMLQLVAGTAVALKLTSLRAYRRSGGAEVVAWRFFDLAVERAGGTAAARALAEVAARERNELASVEAVARAAGVDEVRAEAIARSLGSQGLFLETPAGYGLATEWVRALAREYTGEARGRAVAARLLLRRKIDGGGLLSPLQIREVKRYAGTLDPDEERALRRSVSVGLGGLAALLAIPMVVLGTRYLSHARSLYFDADASPGADVVARLGRGGSPLSLPHLPAFGAIVADSGFARSALKDGLPSASEPLEGEGWLRALLTQLRPLPRGAAALIFDDSVRPLADAYAEAGLRRAVVEAIGAAGKGAPEEVALLRRALSDTNEELRRVGVAAAAALERRASGSAAALLASGLQDSAPSVRARALAEIERLPDEQSAPLLALALGQTNDSVVRRRALEAVAAQVARTPAAASALGRAMLGPARADATALLGRLLDGKGPSVDAAAETLAKVALDARAPEEARLDALRLLRRRPASPAGIEALTGSPRLMAAAMPLVVRAKPDEAPAKVAEALKGPAPLRAAAAAALGLLPKTVETAKLLHGLELDGAVEVRVEAVRALPVLGREALPSLMKDLKSGGAEVERAAIETLASQAGRLGASAAAQALESAAKSPRPSTRRAAIEALGKMAEPRGSASVAALGRLLRDRAPELRAEAASALGEVAEHGGREAISVLRGAARDPDSAVRRRAAVALGRASSSLGGAAARAIGAFSTDEDPGVRLDAARALGTLGAAAQESGALPALISDRDSSVRAAGRRAALAATREEGSRSNLAAEFDRALLSSYALASPSEKIEIAGAAGLVGAAQTVRAALADSDPLVRRAAAETAGGLGPSNVAALMSALADSDLVVRVAAVRGLVRAKAGAALAQAARGPDVDVRVAALEALGDVGGAAALAAVEAALEDASERVRVAAVRGLVPLGREAAPRLEKALRDPARDVRDAAVIGLGTLWTSAATSESAAHLRDEVDADRRYAAALALARAASTSRGDAARKALDEAAANGTPTVRLAARFGRVFVGHPADMPAFLRLLREGN